MNSKRENALERLWKQFDDTLELRSERFLKFRDSDKKDVHARIDACELDKTLAVLMDIINSTEQR